MSMHFIRRAIRFAKRVVSSKLSLQQSSTPAAAHHFSDWRRHLDTSIHWKRALSSVSKGQEVLIATSVGGLSAATILEGMLGVALTLRGARVRFLLCDAVLPACLHIHAGKIKDPAVITEYRLNNEICPGCIGRGRSHYGSLGLPVSYYSDFITEEERRALRKTAREMPVSEIRGYRLKDMNLGEHAMAGALRFFASGNLPATQEAEDVLRRYFEAALITETVIRRYHEQFSPEVAVFHHGIYVPQGVIGEVCRAHGTRVANWQVGYRKKTFIFSHKETYHHTLINEPTDCWTDISWNETMEKEIMSYLKSRWYGSNDWIWFHDQPKHDAELISKETGIDFSKPTISLLTNVFWDAQLHFKANAFRDMLDWVLQSIEYFKGRPDLQLAIRIHPAEVRGAIPSRQPLVDEIRKVYPTLPDNVYVILPDSQVSTYVLCENSDTVIIYGTKTGVELTAMGIPVVVAGEAWIRNKGLTMDATSPGNYFELLDRLPVGKRLDADIINRARKYAFHFFFRRFIPIEFMEPSSNDAPYEIRINDLQDLLPGRDAGLDVLCNGILDGSEFVYPAEKYIGRMQ
ncbi:capsular polysaccharide export protein, LipB/KpsS family [Rhizobium leguminosarum]|uniref:capsular polysaccharide export protein, LipB/KpsS family n=1 Tax=Rhizobium leguminosarum TaxID=384 RepID=UPI0015FAE156|nr:capsule biosynthesis protein [Rhizobium leguminosarum]MBA9031430.1 hypothetical protein [Rhizobium leguminosarum]